MPNPKAMHGGVDRWLICALKKTNIGQDYKNESQFGS